MLRMFLGLGLAVTLLATSGCGGRSNPLPPDAGSPEYAQRSVDKMKTMYGAPKVDSKAAQSDADRMRSMYTPKAGGSSR